MAMASGLRVRVRHRVFGKMKQLAVAAMNLSMNCNFSSTSIDRGKVASMRHHGNMKRLRDEIADEIGIACSSDQECPYLSQIDQRVFRNNDYKSLKAYLHDLRTFNLENKDAPRVVHIYNRNNDENYGFLFNGHRINTHLKALSPAEIQQYEEEKAEKEEKQALEIAHMIINRYNKEQSIRCGQKVNLEFMRVVSVTKTYHRLVRRIVVEASNPHATAGAAAGTPATIRLEATYNWYIGKPHRVTPIPPPYSDFPTHAPSSLEVHAEKKAQADKVVAGDEHNVTALTQAGSDPKWDKTNRHETGKSDAEAEVKFKDLEHLHEKKVEMKGSGVQ